MKAKAVEGVMVVGRRAVMAEMLLAGPSLFVWQVALWPREA